MNNTTEKGANVKERESILEFLFKDGDKNPEILEDYIGKYLEAREKWRLVFECVQNTDNLTSVEEYLYALIQNLKQILPNLKMAVVLYEKTTGKNTVYSIEKGDEQEYLVDSVFQTLNLFRAHLEVTKFYEKRNKEANFRLLPLEKEDMELGYVFFEVQNLEGDGDIGYFENLCRFIISAMENIGLYDSIRQETKDKIKFTASFSHEIKTPLNGVIAYAELMKENSEKLPDDIREYTDNIFACAHQLKCLVMDTIENARFEYGKQEIRRQGFNSKEAIEAILKIFKPSLDEKQVKVTPLLMQANIVSDYTKFNQILYNLISNSVKFSEPNSEIALVSWVEEDKFNFEIKNSGNTIDEKEAGKIFFFLNRGASNVKNNEGSGIGLCVSKELIELLEGEIEFENRKKETIFRFYIPV